MTKSSTDRVFRGMICFSLAVGFEEDRARLGLSVAVTRLRNALAENDLLLPGDDQLLDSLLAGHISSEEFAEALCSMKRMGLPGGGTH
jgi:hypothetical protein